jgi:hypothetical protein
MNTHVAHAPDIQASLPTDKAVDALYSKVSWRIIPLLIVCYMVAYLDRINIGYAQLQMKQVLTFSDAVYGLGAGIFFIGYFLFEVPSNLLLGKIGARKTLLRIMFCWGIVAAAMMFVQTPTQFYVLRFLLGVFEAGLLPRHHPVPHVLVSVEAARPDDRHLHGCHHGCGRHRRPAVRRHHEVPGRRERLGRLAVAVPRAGPASVAARHRRLTSTCRTNPKTPAG